MIPILITLLTLALVLNCLLLILLVLIQLPKKEAGAGLAFGGGATDALFGAGSGNALTKLTKYAAGSFLALALVIGVMNSRQAHASGSNVLKALAAKKRAAAAPAAAARPAQQFETLSSTNLLINQPAVAATNAPATATNVVRSTNAAPVAKTNVAAPK